MDMATTLGNYHSPDPVEVIQKTSIGTKNISVYEKLECANCEWKLWCSGGCPVLVKQIKGDYLEKSPYCEIYKEIIPALLRLEARSLLAVQFYPQTAKS
jgi:uncharacterized protein